MLLWIAAGILYHSDFFWFIRNSYNFLVATKVSTILFDGIISSLHSPSLPKIIKGLILLTITIFSSFCFYRSIKYRDWISTGICFSLLVLTMIINHFEAWVIARYSKLLIIPIISLCARLSETKNDRIVQSVILFILLVSNLIFGFYMVKIFYT